MHGFRLRADDVINFFAVLIFPFSIITLETVLFHLLMIVSNYLQATTVISIAMFGIALGGLVSFYLLRFNRQFVLSVSSIVFFLSIGLSYYSIVRLDNFQFPYLLIVPFFSGSVIVSSIFSRADSHRIYFIDLTASALGVVYPIIAVSHFKSENTLLVLSVLPLLFVFILMFRVKSKVVKAAGMLFSAALITAIILFLRINLEVPRVISADVFNSRIMAKITSPLEQKIMREAYGPGPDGKSFVLKTDDPYKAQMARYAINKTGYYPFVLDLSMNYKPLHASQKIYKIYTEKLQDYTWLFSRDNLMGRVEYITKTNFDFLYINNGAFYDRVGIGDPGDAWDIRFPNYLYNANVFIMGASADGIVNSLKKLPGKTVIKGVEFNPIIHETMMSGYFYELASRAYKNTTIYRTEGRAYLRGTDERFDMITHMNNHAEHGAVCTLAPEYLHTVEGIKEMLDRLTDRGLLVYEEIAWGTRSEWAFLKFMNTIVTALKENGVKSPEKHIVVYRWDYWNIVKPTVYSVVIKRTPFNAVETAQMKYYLDYFIFKDTHKQLTGWNYVYAFPGIRQHGAIGKIITGTFENEPVQFPDYIWYDDFENEVLNHIFNVYDLEFVKSLYTFYPPEKIDKGFDFVSNVWNSRQGRYILNKGIKPADAERYRTILDDTGYSYRMDISPVRDDKPFPYNVYVEKKEVTRILRIVSLLSLVIFIPVLLLVIKKYSSHRLTLLRHSLFFISAGFGYMLVEIVLMQFLQQFIGIPIYSVIITLGALLFFSGVGSLLCSGWNRRVIMVLVFFIPVLIFLYHNSLHYVFDYFASSTFEVRMAAGVGLMVPLSLLMGMPFPRAMETIKKEISAEYATLMYSISGAAGTIAATTALFLNVTYGFSFTFLTGMAAYIIAAILLLTILKGE